MGNNVSSRYENARKTGSLQLSNLKLSKVPEDVKKLVNLRVLDLSFNSIRMIEPWIGSLSSLKSLNISGNKLTCLPTDVSRLTKLETLDASSNRMLSLSCSQRAVNFGLLQHLRTVNISNNNLTEFPVELCSKDIPLDLLDLSKNNIDFVPDCASLLQVIELNLNDNWVSAVSASLAKCPRLKVLRLERNRLRLEDIPLAILENSSISLLSVEGNPLSIKALQELPAYAKFDAFGASNRASAKFKRFVT